MVSRVQPRVLKGFRDFLPADEIPRQRMLRRVVEVFEAFGFGPLSTPALEHTDVLLGKYGAEGDKLLYRFTDHGGRDVALRYDLTVPLARVVAQYRHLPRPFRRYQIAPVWRAEKPARGRFREFLQCDVDVVGEGSMRADAECMLVGLEVLEALEAPGFTMHVSNRKLLDGVLEGLGVVDDEPRKAALRAVDKLDKVGRDGVAAELEREVGLDAEGCAAVLDFLDTDARDRAAVRALGERFPEGSSGRRGAEELCALLEHVEAAGQAERVTVDLGIARGLDYYTGTIYETFVASREHFGSVMSGGRYDHLMETFADEQVPAVGISLGVDRLYGVLADLGLLEQRSAVADVYVALMDEEGWGEMARIARQLRAEGIGAELALRASKIGKQLRHAERQGFRWVVLAGPDERARNVVSLKDLASGEQRTATPSEVPGLVR